VISGLWQIASGTSTPPLFGKQKLGGGAFSTSDLLILSLWPVLQSPLAHQGKKRLKYREESLQNVSLGKRLDFYFN